MSGLRVFNRFVAATTTTTKKHVLTLPEAASILLSSKRGVSIAQVRSNTGAQRSRLQKIVTTIGIRSLATKPYSTEAALKENASIGSKEVGQNVVIGDDSLANLGSRREKIEVDGISLNWDKAGSGEHVVLLLPGIIGCIQTDYGAVFSKMNKEKFTLVSWDPPGYGRSRPPDRDFSGIFYQRDGHLVVKLMDKLGYKKFSILGCSNGGITGGHIAADFPDRVQNLVTWGAHSFVDERTVMFTKLMGDLSVWTPKMLESALALYGREYLTKMLNDWHQGVYDFYHEGLDKTFQEGLARITCPTFVIHGEDDPVLGVDHAEFLRDHIKNCRMYIMPKAKHNLHLKFTDQFITLVEDFLLNPPSSKSTTL